ncbi:hypothetical protein SPBR_08039 [Sporothrix brasiliensis 5110]|uniref:Uncharacterized protein n=1 Tax=Sporothrix brasiliensis 5110 TaxID=1398154 RepID=A0A0C2IWN6_9PEZI|nr:uncharacterized protein SPBR_08039 [Sporothrix brasiliensis 5110]KIH89432.1 hypothetical protein SPBR_08039 [Sporothrix brasiliensis 5110]
MPRFELPAEPAPSVASIDVATMSLFIVSGKTALVTGANGSIGVVGYSGDAVRFASRREKSWLQLQYDSLRVLGSL